jgi:peptidoglycan hydrolase-like protein with peptidoglycan-binding domain
MPLVSSRFRGITKLERCLVDDAAHLTEGTSGSHVAFVQQALLDLGEQLGAGGADGAYGDNTVTAVINFKSARGLTNVSGQIDGIVGKKTIEALDTEIDRFDFTPGPCPPDSNGPVVDFQGQPLEAANSLLGILGLGRLLDVESSGRSRLMLNPEVSDPDALGGVVVGAIQLLGGDVSGVGTLTSGIPAIAASRSLVGFADVTADLILGSGRAASLGSGPALVNALLALGGTTPATAARDLTQDAALREVLGAHQLGTIVLSPPPTFDGSGKVVSPKQGDKLTIGSTVSGVGYKFVNFADRTKPNYLPVAVILPALDARHVIGLIRLAQQLSTRFGVTEIHHVGIGGQTVGGTNCHTQGRACDFVGARGVRNGQPFLLTVLNDWAIRTVPNVADATRPRLPDWPHETVASLTYRLATDRDADALARDFFQALYDFASTEYQDKTAGAGQTAQSSTIGQASFVMTPDHPTSNPNGKNGREAHRGHVHFQIGPTGGV